MLVIRSEPADAAEWEFTPFVGIREVVTDNVGLTEDNRTLDLVSTADIGARVRGDGNRAQLRLDVTGSYDKYVERTDLDGFRGTALGMGTVEVFEEHFFIDARTALRQESLTRDSSGSLDRTIGRNQSQVFNYLVSPHLHSRFGGWADGELRYQFSQQMFLDPDVGGTGARPSDARTHRGLAELTSGEEFGRLHWTLQGDAVRTSREGRDRFEQYTAMAFGAYAITRQWIPVVRVGVDEIKSGELDDDRSGLFWGVGLRVVPSQRSSFEAMYGRRFGGNDISATATFSPTPAVTLHARVQQSATTQQDDFGRNLAQIEVGEDGELINPVTGAPASPNTSSFDIRDRVFVQNRAEIGFAGQFIRTNVNVSAFYANREFDRPDDEETIVGSRAAVTYALTPTVDASAMFSHSQVTEPLAGQSDDLRLNFGGTVGVTLGPTMRMEFGYRRTQFSGGGQDIVENLGFATVRKNF